MQIAYQSPLQGHTAAATNLTASTPPPSSWMGRQILLSQRLR
jgi:hypothetical protein